MLSSIISGSHVRCQCFSHVRCQCLISSCFCGVTTFVNNVFLNIRVLMILEFGSSWAWMLKTDAYLMTKMLRILVRMRPACGARVLMVSTQTLRVEYLCKGSFAFPYIWFSFMLDLSTCLAPNLRQIQIFWKNA